MQLPELEEAVQQTHLHHDGPQHLVATVVPPHRHSGPAAGGGHTTSLRDFRPVADCLCIHVRQFHHIAEGRHEPAQTVERSPPGGVGIQTTLHQGSTEDFQKSAPRHSFAQHQRCASRDFPEIIGRQFQSWYKEARRSQDFMPVEVVQEAPYPMPDPGQLREGPSIGRARSFLARLPLLAVEFNPTP